MRRTHFFLLLILGGLMGGWPSVSLALEADGVLVVYNANSAGGQEIAEYYASVHPGVTLLGLDNVPDQEVVGQDVYLNQIRPYVLAELTDSIDVIVTTKGMPLRIVNSNTGNPMLPNVYSSLESELTRIDTIGSAAQMGNQMPSMPSIPPQFTNPDVLNPYLGQNASFDYETYGIRLTARLDGFSVADVKRSIINAQRASYGDKFFVVDDDPDLTYDRMGQLANVLAGQGVDYSYDNTNSFIGTAPAPVIGYVSHGTHGGAPAGYVLDEQQGLQFEIASGAVFHTWESFNAYSFEEGGNHLGQGLLAEWISRGGAAGVGTVYEPIAASANVANEERIFEMLLQGYTWAEAAWNATMQLSFVNTVVGDPLMTWRETILSADINLDGLVSAYDLDVVLTYWGQTVDVGNASAGDLSGDGHVGNADLDMVLSGYSTTIPLGSQTSHAPEPTTMAMLGLGALALIRPRRRT